MLDKICCYDRIIYCGDTMRKQYLIYADESHRKGKYFSNFYGGALINYTELEKINNLLNAKKDELGLCQEVKWTKVTEQYLEKYMESLAHIKKEDEAIFGKIYGVNKLFF